MNYKRKCQTDAEVPTRHTLSNLRSRMEKVPSSLPDASIQLASLRKEKWCRGHHIIWSTKCITTNKNNKRSRFKHLFQEITFTSASCALKEVAGDFPRRISHIAMFPSTEQEANTSGSVGLHCKDKR